MMFALIVANAASAAPAVSNPELQWTVFNSFGMSVDYPAGIFTLDGGPAIKGAGRKLRSRDGSAGLMFWVEPNPKHYDPASFVKSRGRVAPGEVDYRRVTGRFAVVSAVRGSHIYYSRCNFPSGAGGPMHCIDMIYNKSEKRLWDSVVTRISLSLH